MLIRWLGPALAGLLLLGAAGCGDECETHCDCAGVEPDGDVPACNGEMRCEESECRWFCGNANEDACEPGSVHDEEKGICSVLALCE